MSSNGDAGSNSKTPQCWFRFLVAIPRSGRTGAGTRLSLGDLQQIVVLVELHQLARDVGSDRAGAPGPQYVVDRAWIIGVERRDVSHATMLARSGGQEKGPVAVERRGLSCCQCCVGGRSRTGLTHRYVGSSAGQGRSPMRDHIPGGVGWYPPISTTMAGSKPLFSSWFSTHRWYPRGLQTTRVAPIS